MRIRISSVLHAYTAGASEATAEGGTLAEVLSDLDRQYPGIKFRIVDEQARLRPHIRVFLDGKLSRSLEGTVTPASEVMIVGALSGG